jgi:ribonuclease P protein subunit RPR2
MASSRPVPSPDLARWLGTERGWIEQLAASGEVISEHQAGALLVDPSSLEAWLIRRRGGVGGHDDPSIGMLGLVGTMLASGGPAEPATQSVLDHLAQRFAAASASIFFVTDKGKLVLAAGNGSVNGTSSEATQEIAEWVYETGRSLTLCDPRRVGLPGSGEGGARDTLAVPVRVGSRILGVLALMRRIDQPAFSHRERSLVSIVCTQLGLAVERSRFEDMLGRRLEEANLVYRQLEAYARDVRETYAAEKQRAEDLSHALTELEQTYLATVRGLAVAVEAKDEYTAGHLVRVTSYGLMIMELLAPDLAREPQYEYGFLLHDVGKLGVPDAVLKKPGPLDDSEWELMRRHPMTGRRILEGIPFLTDAKEIVYSHHERWDGKGYPKGLREDEVVLGGRVFPIADTFDAMTSDRPYRKALPFDDAIEEIARGSGTQFWPDAVAAFLSIPRDELEAASQARRDGWSDDEAGE